MAGTKPVLAEFEIQEAGIEKGEVELEYRGAYHWSLPQAEEDEEVPFRQSHDFEIQMGITWLVEGVELETLFQLIKRHGNGIALSFATGCGWATQPDMANWKAQ